MFNVLKPSQIGKMTLKNSIVMAPMGHGIGNCNQETYAYYMDRARGGVGMILCNTMITDYFEDASHSLLLNEASYKGFKKICDDAHEQNCKVCVQFMPGCGRMGQASKRYPVPISASDCSWLHQPDVTCHALTLEEIALLQEEYRTSLGYALKAGADCIELHFYGGYLGDQFLTEAWNTRQDKYGGDIRGRATFAVELIEIAKEIAGQDFPVIIKYTPDHCLTYPGFRQIDEGIALGKIFEEAGADALHIDAGCHEIWKLAMPPIYYQDMTPQINASKEVKAHVTIPVMTNGRLGDVEKAEATLKEEVCDLVVIGRGLLADPELVNKLQDNRPEDIRPCISCNEGCIGSILKGEHVKCAVNPFCGFESVRKIEKTSQPKNVLVVGGGPAGCEAALLAHREGHKVTLWEKGMQIGGKLLAACAPTMKRDMEKLVDYYKIQLLKANVPVVLGMEADYDSIKEFAPEQLIWATGGTLFKPSSISGINEAHVYSCEQALRHLVPLGKNIAIVGGGLVGVETAIDLDNRGYQVSIVEMADTLLPNPPFVTNGMMLKEFVKESRINVLTGVKLEEITQKHIIVRNQEGEAFEYPAETVLLGLGYQQDVSMAEMFTDICEVKVIGDSVRCRDILSATSEAYDAVKAI